MGIFEAIKNILREKVLLLDGGMGTMIQKYEFKESDFRGREFLSHPNPISGFNDILNITKPAAIKKIHEQYLESGADILSTNTFNSNLISLRDYGLDKTCGLIERLNIEGALIARKAIEEFEEKNGGERTHFVAGSIGPTNRSASMSPDISRPEFRNIDFDVLKTAYKSQISGLLKGGVDLLLFETVFDTLNLKAGLDAANEEMMKSGMVVPIMISATVADKSGRILSGQTVAAFTTSVANYENVISIGLNCGFGPKELQGYLKDISHNCGHYVSCHPNAGLPDVNGCYNVSPDDFKNSISPILIQKQVNIIGGCCGTTPAHIAAIRKIADKAVPYHPELPDEALRLSGLDSLVIKDKNDFLVVGERCNVAGSKKFLRLIKEKNISEAVEIAAHQIREGAAVIDINMDDPMLDSKEEMVEFIRYISSEPDIAKVPFMIDSSRWEVIEAALKNIQGKGIVNSLSLKEGEDKFIVQASRVHKLGFALIVMAFDEKGQADTYERKIEICGRAYRILTEKCGFKPDDIIFDVNVMAIATGIEEHSRYALDFIRAVEWIKKNLPGTRTSGGVSNLSFSFRGKNRLREIMHTVFLYHSRKAGLDMAIVNPSSELNYEEIDSDVRNIVEDVILARREDAENELLNLALTENEGKKYSDESGPLTSMNIDEILRYDMLKGNLHNLEEHLDVALKKMTDPIAIIEGPLMEGMKQVGELFGEGKMFLPQVVKTARVMNRAVEYLSPYFKNSEKSEKKTGKVLIATVKGDVHDIGKNIVSTVLSCNNFEVIDLGVMVPVEKILEAVESEKPDIICLSGLITPSLAEMGNVAKVFQEKNLKIPLLVGGATTSRIHTAVKLSPIYPGKVIHVNDASQNALVANILVNKDKRESFLRETDKEYSRLCEAFSAKNGPLVPYVEAVANSKKRDLCKYITPKPFSRLKTPIILDLKIDEIKTLINWKMFFKTWGLTGTFLSGFPNSLDENDVKAWKENLTEENRLKGEEVLKLYENASNLIHELENSGKFDGKAVVVFDELKSENEKISFGDLVLPMLRQQNAGSSFLSCADFVESKGRKKDWGGLFCVTAGNYLTSLAEEAGNKGDEYKKILYQSLADRIAEAGSEWFHRLVKEELWGYEPRKDNGSIEGAEALGHGIRPAWGYPMLPDQTLLLATKEVLPYDELGVRITENGAMWPTATVSGLYIANPEAKYFMVGPLGEDQLREYAASRNISYDRALEILRV